MSINSVSRVEVTKVPTPDSPADALGGSINLVTKSAFERASAEFRYRAYTSFNSDSRMLDPVKAPGNKAEHQIKPGFDFTYVNPLSSSFGFTLNALNSNQYNPQFRSQEVWVPHYTGNAAVPPDNPYLSTYQISDVPKSTSRASYGGSMDWRITRRDVLSLSYQYSDYDAMFGGSNLTWAVGTTPSWTTTSVQGRNNAGNATIGTNFRRKTGNTWQPNLTFRHTGPVWTIDGGLYYSHSRNRYEDVDQGFFENVSLRIAGATVGFSDIAGVRPGTITTIVGGTAVDPFELDNYRILSARSSQNFAEDTEQGGRLNFKRTFGTRVPLSVKGGVDVRENRRDIRYPQKTYTFVGADGVANSADDNGGFLANEARKELGTPYGFSAIEWPDVFLLHDLFVAHPEYFKADEAATYRTAVLNSKQISERVSSAYLRGDARLFANRLWLVGGVRFERTDDEGHGFIDDITAVPPTVTDPLEVAKIRYQERANHARTHYQDFFPSLNGTYNLRENLLLRFGYAKSLGRPDFSNIIPGATIPDAGGATPTITASNTGLRPWQADNYDLTLQYFFGKKGVLSLGIFRKNFTDFFGTVTTDATPELLESFGLDPALASEGYQVKYTNNVGSAHITGYEFDYSQSLDYSGAPAWLGNLSVFCNGTFLDLAGERTADFSNFIKKSINYGLAYRDKKLRVQLNWNYRGRQRGSPVTGTGIPDDTYDYVRQRLQLDLSVEYSLRKAFGLFVAARNITGESYVFERYSPQTPDYAWQFRHDDYGTQITAGFKGTF